MLRDAIRSICQIDMAGVYFGVCWFAAFMGVLEMQKIARREIMARVRASMRHLVRITIALLMVALLTSAYDVLHGRDAPSPADLGIVTALALMMFAHAASGCWWAHDRPSG